MNPFFGTQIDVMDLTEKGEKQQSSFLSSIEVDDGRRNKATRNKLIELSRSDFFVTMATAIKTKNLYILLCDLIISEIERAEKTIIVRMVEL